MKTSYNFEIDSGENIEIVLICSFLISGNHFLFVPNNFLIFPGFLTFGAVVGLIPSFRPGSKSGCIAGADLVARWGLMGWKGGGGGGAGGRVPDDVGVDEKG